MNELNTAEIISKIVNNFLKNIQEEKRTAFLSELEKISSKYNKNYSDLSEEEIVSDFMSFMEELINLMENYQRSEN